MREQIEGQISIFDIIPESKPKEEDPYKLPCDDCGHDIQGCCDYDYIKNHDYCVLGSKWIPKKDENDDYIREHPDCFYVYGHYLSRSDGWHKVPDELPTFTEWTLIDVVLYGQKTGTPWMEHKKWEAKDWTFRSIDQRRDTESTEILAWAPSERGEDGKNQNTCTI